MSSLENGLPGINFGHSQTFGLIIAAMQIIGSYLLLFRGTMLLAAIILFSFMLNQMIYNACLRSYNFSCRGAGEEQILVQLM
jgi:hypothetical protein